MRNLLTYQQLLYAVFETITHLGEAKGALITAQRDNLINNRNDREKELVKTTIEDIEWLMSKLGDFEYTLKEDIIEIVDDGSCYNSECIKRKPKPINTNKE